jgi:hypothetical protein
MKSITKAMSEFVFGGTKVGIDVCGIRVEGRLVTHDGEVFVRYRHGKTAYRVAQDDVVEVLDADAEARQGQLAIDAATGKAALDPDTHRPYLVTARGNRIPLSTTERKVGDGGLGLSPLQMRWERDRLVEQPTADQVREPIRPRVDTVDGEMPSHAIR